jgi:transcriptional regulator with GAF, ATPase, and Fis domain
VTLHLRGESGTGKELVAAAIHYTGSRAEKPFVKVNCSALPETLLESELFGHVKGAFTGALANKVGRFERADGGTLLIDEVGDMSPIVQLKLLRALETKEFERLGESTSTRVDVRIVTATHRDLRALVDEGKFREDLYYRVNVFRIEIPPLRERREDVPLLADHFRERFAEETGRRITGFSPNALRVLVAYRWPGNVRELENAVEHAFVTARGSRIGAEDLPDEVRSKPAPAPVRRGGAGERQAIQDALERSGGHRERAAAELGISRVTLWKRMKRLGLTWPPGSAGP